MMRRPLPGARRLAALAALVAAVLALAPSPAVAAEDVLTDLQGRSLEAGAFGRGTVIAVFMATWSPRCRDVVERVQEIESRWGDRARVVLIDFQEDADTVRRFVGDKPPVRVYLDAEGAYSKEHAITFLPGLLVLQDGAVAFRGRLGNDPNSVLSQILG